MSKKLVQINVVCNCSTGRIMCDIAKEAEKKAIKEAKARVSTFVNTNEEIEGIRFTKEDKKVLASYMNDKVVKLNNGNTITTMQKELFIDLPKNEKLPF